jgi:hypothetical protein
MREYVRTKPPDRPWCNPGTWLNQGRWLDEPAIDKGNGDDRKSSYTEAVDRNRDELRVGLAAAVARRMEGGGWPPDRTD